MIKLSTFLLFTLLLMNVKAQNSLSKKEWRLYNKIYAAALDSLIDSPSRFILIDSTNNGGIQDFRFSNFVNDYRLFRGHGFDSIWLSFLEHGDEKKSNLVKIKLRAIKSIHSIILLNNDSAFIKHARFDQVGAKIEPYGLVDGAVRISTPLISGDKTMAIVDIAYTTGIKSGYGGTISLKKRKDGKWVVNQFMIMWVDMLNDNEE